MNKYVCKHCKLEYNRKGIHSNSYCTFSCQRDYQYEQKVNDWLSGKIPGWTGNTRQINNFVRKYLHTTRGTACEICKWDRRHPVDGAVLTEIDHIDGDAENCKPENLKILCPNCHSMTPTFRRRNKVSKRNRK